MRQMVDVPRTLAITRSEARGKAGNEGVVLPYGYKV